MKSFDQWLDDLTVEKDCKESFDNFPSIWIETLVKIQTIWPEAVIAGGALRDYLHGRFIKDVDIFIPFDNIERIKELGFKDLVTIKINGNTNKDAASGFEDDDRPKADHFIFKKSGWTFEISPKYEPVEKLFDNFDIGLCMVKYDGKYLTRTKEYIEDSTNKTLTIYRTNKYSEPHLERIKLKYLDFTVVRKVI